MHRFANPGRFMRFGAALLPWTTAGAILCLAIGLLWGFVFAPPDYQQGEAVRIIYIHVPAAWMAMFIYTMVVVWFHRTGHESVRFPFRPWYRHKAETSFADMLTTLRRLSYEEKIEGALGEQMSREAWIAQLIELLSRTG